MSDANKNNLYYFENESMRGLFNLMNEWQKENKKRLLSISIQKDTNMFCCIALSNPTEVVICGADGYQAKVTNWGSLHIKDTGGY